ncbi:hypothetical protein FRC04_006474 [Tulasnella sp. 424]|nr:hypothetical protein FRC04_006474 [Tulasnella sp. 424]KAG8980520.1 hypothetical protein FRC05_006153 [Tulasnella sp. 425]
MSQIPGTLDPRRRPSNASSTGGTESTLDLNKIQAQLQDPSFVAVLEHAVRRSNSGSQPPTPTVSAPPGGLASSWGPGANQPQPQAPSQSSHPPPPAKDAWGNTAAPNKPWGQRSPQRRGSQSWQSSAPSSDPWGTKAGPSANSSWANVSSSSALPSDSWGFTSGGDWGSAVLANATWGPQPTATPAQAWPTSAAPEPEKPTFEARSTFAAPPMPPSTSSSSRGNIETQHVASNALPPPQHVSHETPAPNEPPRRPEKLPLTIPNSLQSNKRTSDAQRAPFPKPASVDEPPPSPDKLYDSSKPGDDPELVAWRAIIKYVILDFSELVPLSLRCSPRILSNLQFTDVFLISTHFTRELGSVYRDHVHYQELAEQRSELEALAQRAAARSKARPETSAGQADGGPYSGKIKELREQMGSSFLKQETRAAEWAAALTGGPSTAAGSSQSGEAAVLVGKRSKALWPFEPPEGEYIPKGQANAKATADLESTRNQIQKMAETLDEARSELGRIYADLIKEMEMQDSAVESDVGNAVEEPSTTTPLSGGPETPDSMLDSDPAEELRHLESEVDRLRRDVDFIVSERHSMWEDAHAALGLERPGEEEGEVEVDEEGEEETRSPTSDNTAPPKVLGQDVNSEVDGDEMNIDGRTEGAITDEMDDEAEPSPVPEENEDTSTTTRESIEAKLTATEGTLDATALQAWPLVKAIDNLVMEEMCQADIALLVASNEDLKARMFALEEQGRVEDVQLQQLYGAVMALDTGGQPNIDQLIDGIVKPIVDEVEAYMHREFGQRARTQDQAWQDVGNQLEALMEPTLLVLRAILNKADTLSPQQAYPNGNGAQWHE